MTHADGPGDAVERILRHRMSRRRVLIRGAQLTLAAGAAGIGIAVYLVQQRPSPWNAARFAPPGRSTVAVLRAPRYTGDLEGVVWDALRLLGVDVEHKRVLLKPNIVEF